MKKVLLTLFSVVMLFTYSTEAKTITLNENNLLVLDSQFSPDSVSKVQAKAMELCAKNGNKDLYLYLDTPGGSIMAGMSMINSLNSLTCRVHTITESAASMGYQTVQHLGNRYILPHGFLMSHRAKLGGLGGQIPGELEVRLKFYKDLVKSIDVITSSRVGMSLQDYKKLIHDEFWIIGAEAVKAGHADEVVSIICDSSLRGTSTKTSRTFFGTFEAEYSDCPTIRAPLNVTGLNGASVSDFFEFIYKKDALVNF